MIILEWNGEIGWELTIEKVNEDLTLANRDDITVRFSSPGGFISVGGDIYLALFNYRKENPKAKMILEIGSVAASYASLIASSPVWNIVKVHDISQAMYHNPINGIMGDFRKFEENAVYLKDARDMFVDIYTGRSKMSLNKMTEMMDKTTWLMGGQAIIDAGFADELISTDGSDDPDMSMIAEQAKTAFKTTMAKMVADSQSNEKPFDYEGAITCMSAIKTSIKPNKTVKAEIIKPSSEGQSKMEVPVDTLEELEKEKPDLFKAAMKKGADKEKEGNSARVKALTEMKTNERYKKVPEMVAVIDDAIKDGKSKDECMTEMNAVMLTIFNDPTKMSALESPGDINGGGDPKPTMKTKKQAEV